MAKRKVFYSFHFANDFWRTQQVRNIGVIEGDAPVSKNDWEEVKKKGDANIEKWIEDHLSGKSCLVVLIGSETASRRWIKHEIKRAWSLGKGVVGVRIHNLKDQDSKQSTAGSNPFSTFTLCDGKVQMDSVVDVYNPPYSTSTDVYNYIANNIETWIENAIKTRNDFKCP
ncbi:MAG: TIR domain-containing protein [Flavobacteriales bacterium]|nr:TIR domain-containing protein [Flavobacteriales bacterium]